MSTLVTDNLPLIATAPDGIKRLRGLILELAVRGKLVPQDPADEPASELLKRIETEKARLVKEGKIRKPKAVEPVGVDERPFDLPEGWDWTRLGTIARDWGQKCPDADFTYIDVAAIDNLLGKINSPEVLRADEAPSRARKLVQPGTVIYSTVRPYLLNVAVIEKNYTPEAIASTAFAIVHPLGAISSQYLFWFLRSPVFVGYVESVQTGIAYPAINDGQFFAGCIPLPPLPEQHRIVARVDELMALCDRLEAEQADAAEAHARLVDALLATLTASRDATECAANWQRLREHFDTLFTTEASITALKQSVLLLAAERKLVSPTTGEPASLVRLDSVAAAVVDCPHSTPKWSDHGKICVRTSQFRPGFLDLAASRYVTEQTFEERIARLQPQADDILYSREGGILGVACRVPPGVELCLGQRMMLIRCGPQIDSSYLELVLNSPVITRIAREMTTGGAAPRVNVATVKGYPIPLPPLPEQHRIVAKVDKLIALCDRLQADLATAREHRARLAVTLVQAALAVA